MMLHVLKSCFASFQAIHPNSPLRFQSQLMLGQLHFDAGKYSQARSSLFELLHASTEPEVVAAAHYLRGWCYIHTTDWNKAISELRQVNTSEMGVFRRKKASELADTLLAETPLPSKSPTSGRLAFYSRSWEWAALRGQSEKRAFSRQH